MVNFVTHAAVCSVLRHYLISRRKDVEKVLAYKHLNSLNGANHLDILYRLNDCDLKVHAGILAAKRHGVCAGLYWIELANIRAYHRKEGSLVAALPCQFLVAVGRCCGVAAAKHCVEGCSIAQVNCDAILILVAKLNRGGRLDNTYTNLCVLSGRLHAPKIRTYANPTVFASRLKGFKRIAFDGGIFILFLTLSHGPVQFRYVGICRLKRDMIQQIELCTYLNTHFRLDDTIIIRSDELQSVEG